MIHPTGTFDAVVEEHGIGESKHSGTPQVIVKFSTVTPSGHDSIWGYFPLTERAAQYTVDKLRAMGFTGNNIEEINDGQCMRGNGCSITVTHEKYNGKLYPRVQFVNAAGERQAREIKRSKAAAAKARMFNALLHKTPSKAMPPVNDAKAPPRPAKAPATPTLENDRAVPQDDDIPF